MISAKHIRRGIKRLKTLVDELDDMMELGEYSDVISDLSLVRDDSSSLQRELESLQDYLRNPQGD